MSAPIGRVEIFAVESLEALAPSIICITEDDARDVVLAYALRDEVVLISEKTISMQEISEVDERGRLTLFPVIEYEMA